MPTKSALIQHPGFLRACWIADVCVAFASPTFAFIHYQCGRTDHAIFWMIVAIWAGRGASIRYLAKLINDPLAEPTTVVVRKPTEVQPQGNTT
jgi:hypothetical protein